MEELVLHAPARAARLAARPPPDAAPAHARGGRGEDRGDGAAWDARAGAPRPPLGADRGPLRGPARAAQQLALPPPLGGGAHGPARPGPPLQRLLLRLDRLTAAPCASRKPASPP